MTDDIILNKQIYNNIIDQVKNHEGCFRKLEAILSTKYKLPKLTVSSIINNYIVRQMRNNHYRVARQSNFFWESYNNAVLKNQKVGVIVRMSQKAGIAPALMAKLILEKFLYRQENSNSENGTKDNNLNEEPPLSTMVSPRQDPIETKTKIPGEGRNMISRLFRDTSLIPDGRLALEILMCQLQDSQYGPILEIYNRAIGEEYEALLYEKSDEANLCYQSENDLRSAGYDKTPDLKLIVPIAVGGFVVNWIESKGLFGDENVHKSYIFEQYASYWNRFGPGLVIYWLGYEESVADPLEKRFIVRCSFPKDIIYMKPVSMATEMAFGDQPVAITECNS